MPVLYPKIQLLLAAVVVVAGIHDIRTRRIPNWLVLPGLLLGFAVNGILEGWPGLLHAGAGFGLALLVYVPLYLLRAMGAGDVKLMATVGAIVGAGNWFIIFMITGILGGVFALVITALTGRLRKTFSNVGLILWEVSHLRAPHAANAELDIKDRRAVTMPHGAVIALGCLAFMAAGVVLAR
jgi:prepilin peptidase CpaA